MELRLEVHGRGYDIKCTVDEFLELSEKLAPVEGVIREGQKSKGEGEKTPDRISGSARILQNHRGKEVIVIVNKFGDANLQTINLGPVIVDTYKIEGGLVKEITVASLRYPDGITFKTETPMDSIVVRKFEGEE